jgi:hypothetical protein
MNAHNDPDERLGRVLRHWRVEAPLPGNFQAGVWEAIARAERKQPTTWRLLVAQIEHWLLRPVPAFAYATVLLTLGLSLGYWHGQTAKVDVQSTLQQQYLQSVDPYRQAALTFR